MTKQWPRLLNANASYAKADLWFVKGRKKLVRKPCAFAKKQERRTVNLNGTEMGLSSAGRGKYKMK